MEEKHSISIIAIYNLPDKNTITIFRSILFPSFVSLSFPFPSLYFSDFFLLNWVNYLHCAIFNCILASQRRLCYNLCMIQSRIVLISVFSILSCGIVSTGFAAKEKLYKLEPFSRYQPILDRMPFGPMPSGLNPDGTVGDGSGEQVQTPVEVQVEQQQLARQVKMSCVNISPDGETMIGFTDLSGKPQKNYYLAVGESSDGWSIEDADYDQEWAKLKKDGVEITVQLGKGLIDPSKIKGGKSSGSAVASVPNPRASVMPLAVPSHTSSQRTTSLRDRLLSRRKSVGGLVRGNMTGTGTTESKIQSSPRSSFTERLKERKRQRTAEQAAKEKATQERLLKLAREAAAAELSRQKAEEAEAAADEAADFPQ